MKHPQFQYNAQSAPSTTAGQLTCRSVARGHGPTSFGFRFFFVTSTGLAQKRASKETTRTSPLQWPYNLSKKPLEYAAGVGRSTLTCGKAHARYSWICCRSWICVCVVVSDERGAQPSDSRSTERCPQKPERRSQGLASNALTAARAKRHGRSSEYRYSPENPLSVSDQRRAGGAQPVAGQPPALGVAWKVQAPDLQ